MNRDEWTVLTTCRMTSQNNSREPDIPTTRVLPSCLFVQIHIIFELHIARKHLFLSTENFSKRKSHGLCAKAHSQKVRAHFRSICNAILSLRHLVTVVFMLFGIWNWKFSSQDIRQQVLDIWHLALGSGFHWGKVLAIHQSTWVQLRHKCAKHPDAMQPSVKCQGENANWFGRCCSPLQNLNFVSTFWWCKWNFHFAVFLCHFSICWFWSLFVCAWCFMLGVRPQTSLLGGFKCFKSLLHWTCVQVVCACPSNILVSHSTLQAPKSERNVQTDLVGSLLSVIYIRMRQCSKPLCFLGLNMRWIVEILSSC